MADKPEDSGRQADPGKDNLDTALKGGTSMLDLSDEQLAFMGGERDELDTMDDPTDFELGNDPDAKPPEDKDGEDDDADKDKDKDKEGDGDAEGDGEKDGEDDDSGDADAGDADADADKDGDKEGDAEGDADAEGEGEEGEGDKDKGKKSEQTIPKRRFDEVNARRKTAEDENRRLKAEKAAGDDDAPVAFDFTKAEIEAQSLLLDGKKEDYAAKRAEIRAAERAEIRAELSGSGRASATEVQEDSVIDAIAEDFEGRYLELDPKNADTGEYSEDIMADFKAMYTGYTAAGPNGERPLFSRPEAVKLALDNVVKIYGLKDVTKDGGGGDGEGDLTVEEKEAEAKLAAIKAEKKKAAAKKKAAQGKGAPPDHSDTGNSGDSDGETELDVETMSDEELDALPASSLARMRGDTV